MNQFDFLQRKQMIQVIRLMYERCYLIGRDGNLSIRQGDYFLTTPAGRNKYFLQEGDLVEVDVFSSPVDKTQKPSSEFQMHKTVYDHRKDVKAVVHAHSLYATLFACMDEELDLPLLTESVICLGRVPKAKMALPSTNEVSESILPWIMQTDHILLENHGVLCYGIDLEDAYSKLETLEHFAKVQFFSSLGGDQKLIEDSRVEQLITLRKKYGLDISLSPRRTSSSQ